MNPIDLRCPKCARPLAIATYHCDSCELTVEGASELPPLARLTMHEQTFVTAFVRVHGNLKKMEALFGISYPTVKNRLNAISRKLDAELNAPGETGAILDRLARGEVTVDDALRELDRQRR